MKTAFLSFVVSGAVIAVIDCSGPQKPDPVVEACKSACLKKMELCVKKGAGNEAKKAACEVVGDKCLRECTNKK